MAKTEGGKSEKKTQRQKTQRPQKRNENLNFQKITEIYFQKSQEKQSGMAKPGNKLGNKHGIGRVDIVENRYVGMKARGCYETPGGTIMLKAHRAIESLTLDREAAHLKDELMPRYAKLIYQGYWFSPEREMLQAAIDATQKNVEGKVRLKLYKGNVMVIGRDS